LLLSQRLSPICSSRQTASCLAIVRLRKLKVFMGSAKPAIFEKLSKLFYFFADNLALAKFKCQTDNEYPSNLHKNKNSY